MPMTIRFLTFTTVPSQSGRSGKGIEERSNSGQGMTRIRRLTTITATTQPAIFCALFMPS